MELQQTFDIVDSSEREQEVDRLAEQLDVLDTHRIQLMKAAEAKCVNKALTTTYVWSTALMEAGQAITYWKDRKVSAQMGISVTEYSGYIAYLHTQYEFPIEELTIQEVKK